MSASELYLEAVPLIHGRNVRLLDHPVLIDQLCQLERNIVASGRERVTHPDRGHDDIANAVCGVLVMARQRGVAMPVHRLQAYAIGGSYEPQATAEDNARALAREEHRAVGGGYFSGPGWPPTWREDGLQVQAYAEE